MMTSWLSIFYSIQYTMKGNYINTGMYIDNKYKLRFITLRKLVLLTVCFVLKQGTDEVLPLIAASATVRSTSPAKTLVKKF